MLHAGALCRQFVSKPLPPLSRPRILSVCTNLTYASLFRTPHNRHLERPARVLLALPYDRFKQTSRRHCSSMPPVIECQQSDLFRYTSGRWLWDEEKQRSERYRKFNVQNLQRIAAECVHANRCIETKKIGEGSYNKVFRLVFDTGAVIIARIPNPNAGPTLYTTASEVATMEFARTFLSIPVPQVLAWSSDVNNSVGAEYILMEEATGRPLMEVWDEMEIESKATVVEDLVAIEKKMLSIGFSKFGSLYYSADNISVTQNVEVVGDVEDSLKNEIAARFCVGPVVEREFWSQERCTMNIDRGPWNLPEDYIAAIAEREISWISRFASPKKAPSLIGKSSAAQTSPGAHIDLLRRFTKVAPYLVPKEKLLWTSRLWHQDLSAANLFIHEGRITGVIDWQTAWTGPLFLQAQHSKLLHHNGELMLRLPENFKDLDEDEQTQVQEQVESSILVYIYETTIASENPLLSLVHNLPLGRLRRNVVTFCENTWEDDILPFRQCLIRIERYWDELSTDRICPIHFTAEELQDHAEDGRGWNDVQEFWDSISTLVARDGWTSLDSYAQARLFFTELRDNGLRTLEGEERDAFERETRWAQSTLSEKANRKPSSSLCR